MQSVSSIRAKIAELQRALEQKLKSIEEIDQRVVEAQISEVPSSARVEISRLVAEDRVADGLKIESDLRHHKSRFWKHISLKSRELRVQFPRPQTQFMLL